ncbi:cytochrome P450 [Streptomyces sp. NPDC016172]|uniref:cytochrome P450 n=1 Tax=Streptomyces sp. NPDC016172 TaxID=3364964 RepID=UPI0036F924D9
MFTTTTEPGPVAPEDIDLFPVELYRSGDPHAAWHTLRAEAPIWRQIAPDGTEFWSVHRYQDVVDVLRDTARFSSTYSTMLTVLGDGDSARDKAIHLMDPPRHGMVRGRTISTLSMRVMREQEQAVRARIGGLVASAVAQDECDFAAVAAGLPMAVAGEVLGIPEELWPETTRWTVASMAPEDPAYTVGDARSTLMEAHVFLMTVFQDLIAERRARPRQDLITRLTEIVIDDRPITDDEVVLNCYAFLMGANPTVPQSAAHFVLAMAQDEKLWQQARTEPNLIPGLVEETLRWSSPVNHLLRRTTEEVRWGDEVIPAGGLVAAWLASANRDESVFADPYVFDPSREPNPHVAFGFGAHRCIGNSAAQFGLRLLIEEVTQRVESVEQVGEVRHLASNFLNGITSLPVHMRPAGSM